MIGGLGRNRTNDTRIFNPLLYQLSYRAKLSILASTFGVFSSGPFESQKESVTKGSIAVKMLGNAPIKLTKCCPFGLWTSPRRVV